MVKCPLKVAVVDAGPQPQEEGLRALSRLVELTELVDPQGDMKTEVVEVEGRKGHWGPGCSDGATSGKTETGRNYRMEEKLVCSIQRWKIPVLL